MKNPLKNFGNNTFHGQEKKFGIAVLGVVFIILFIAGAFLLWNQNRVINDRNRLITEKSMLVQTISELQEELSGGESAIPQQQIDASAYQTIELENGDIFAGKAVEDTDGEITIEQPVKLNGKSDEAAAAALRINRKNISNLRNVPGDSVLAKMLKGRES